MARIVMKFGGTSVADIARIRNVARHVKREVDTGMRWPCGLEPWPETNELSAGRARLRR